MKAIVLTYDRNRPLTNHMIACYARLWPEHPLVFRIPYQVDAHAPDPCREYVQCPAAIKPTVLALLDDIDDQEWVYWCIDDKYPIRLDVDIFSMVVRWITDHDDPAVSGILLCRARKMLLDGYLTGETIRINREKLLERKAYHQIWIHQFVRAGVIRHLFRKFPDTIEKAADMDPLKDRIEKPGCHRLYVTETNRAIFGESTEGGVVTGNCLESFVEYGIPLPPSFSVDARRRTVIGEM